MRIRSFIEQVAKHQCCGQTTSKTKDDSVRQCDECGAKWNKVELGWSKQSKKKVSEDKSITCPACKEGKLFYDKEIEGACCDTCGEQYHSKAMISKVKGLTENREQDAKDELDNIQNKIKTATGEELEKLKARKKKLVSYLKNENIEEGISDKWDHGDKLGKKCESCGEGTYKVAGADDKNNDTLHCSACGAEIARYKKNTEDQGKWSPTT